MRVFFTVLTLLLLPTLSANASIQSSWTKERALYKAALKAPASKRVQKIHATLPRLGNYPLRPYLEYQLISRQLTTRSGNKVRSFQKKYADSPLTRNLQADWLSLLYRKGLWRSYLKEFDRLPLRGATQECRQQIVRLKMRDRSLRKKALSKAETLWSVGKSQPKACDPLFASWKKAGKLTSAKALKRFWLSVEKGNYGLARYLQRYISSRGDKAHVKRFWEIKKNPARLFRQVRKTDDLHTLAFGLKRLLRKQPERTVNYWLKVRNARKLTTVQHASIDTMLAQRLVTHSSPKKFSLIARLDRQHKIPEVTEAHLRLLLQQKDWPMVATLVKKLPEDSRRSDIWKYWEAVALKNTSKNATQHKQAHRLLLDLAKKRQYYGYLAATLTGQPYRLQADNPARNSAIRKKLARSPAIQRAIELNKLGKSSQSGAEWRNAMKGLSENEQKYAALLADELGWHFTAITSAARVGAWDLVKARFPRPYAQTFKKLARKRNIDENWALAIARQESAFNPRARSRVGARGLMQLMPRTAVETARNHKVSYRSRNQLFNPATNISLGTAYLGDMLKKFNGNRALASAAYNAGPHRVSRWMKERGTLPLDVWIESIPFKETRRYVKNVLTYRVIYQLDAGQRGRFMEKNEIARLSIKPVSAKQLLVLNSAEQAATRSSL